MLDQERAGVGAIAPVKIAEAAWLGPSALLCVGELGGVDRASTAAVELDSERRVADARGIVVGDLGALVVALPGLQARLRAGAALDVGEGDSEASLQPEELDAVMTDLQTLVRHNFAPLDPADRERVVEHVARTSGSVPVKERQALCEQLHSIREALRERLPASVISETQPHGLHFDRVLVVDDRSFYLEGWVHDEDSSATRVVAVSPEGQRAEIFARMYRFPRADVESFLASMDASAHEARLSLLHRA